MTTRFWHNPTLRLALLINQAPMALFAVGILAVTVALMVLIGARVDLLVAALDQGTLTREALEKEADGIRTIWMASLVGFLVFLGLVSALSLWVYRRVAARLDAVVAFSEARLHGEDAELPDGTGEDVLARLERAIIAVSDASAAKAADLKRESELGFFNVQLQRAFDLAGSEPQTLDVVHRALASCIPGKSAQVLMADSSQAHLKPMPGSHPGCSVGHPTDCAAVRRGSTLSFLSSEHLDACPLLRERDAPCSAVCTPLTVMGRTVGVLHVWGAVEQLPDDSQQRLIEVVATHAGNRLSVLRTLAGAQLQASTDPLTGLLNRRSFEDAAQRLMVTRAEEEHCVVMVDLDHFKNLNDSSGHQAGDRALKLFARVLKGTVRSEDVVGRHGGEEFVLMLPGCDADQGARLIERVRAELADSSSSYDGPPFTASFGLSSFGRDGGDVPELLRAADRALYAAKAAGRDRLIRVVDMKAGAGA